MDVSLTVVYQYADFSKDVSGNVGKGSVATDISLNFHPTVYQTGNKSIGLFARVGVNTHTSTGDLKNFYSAGVVIKELPLNGQVGIGIAYSLGNKKISSLKDAKTGEIYYEFPLWEGDITFDLQWDRERFETQTLEATTFGVRFTVAF